jgi:hypothetical protein
MEGENYDASQERFENIIKGEDKSKIDYIISEPLEGSINLGVFAKDGRRVKSLRFSKGGITDITNFPEGLKSLYIDENELTQLPVREMRNLIELSCNNNKISRVEGINLLTNLRTLMLNDNDVSDLGELPPGLVHLEVNNNPQLQEISLKGAPNCKYLSCLNNPRLYAIYDVPLGNENFKLFKDDKTQILSHKSSDSDEDEDKPHNDDILYPVLNESIEKYYELKSRYEISRQKQIRDIVRMKASAQKKRRIVRGLIPKCINCKKDGGTKFWTENGHLRAVCGNKTNPCNLNIDIFKGVGISSFEYMYNLLNEEVEADKREIIQLKMNTIFNYMEEKDTARKFKNVLKDYKTTEFIMNGYLENEKNRFLNPDIQSIVSKKVRAVQISLKENRELIAEYKNTGDRRILQQAVEKHINEITPDLKTVRDLKYPVMEMMKIGDENHIFQLPYNMTELYHYPDTSEKPRVIKFSK